MKKIGFRIRKAGREDTSLLLQMICELAKYEQLLHEVKADEEALTKNLFFDNSDPEVLIAEEDATPVGFVLFFQSFSTFVGKKGFYIEDLYVREEFRSKGYGAALLREICRLAIDRNCGRVEWRVLNWNERAIQFYKKIGALPMNEWTDFRLNEKTIDQLVKNPY